MCHQRICLPYSKWHRCQHEASNRHLSTEGPASKGNRSTSTTKLLLCKPVTPTRLPPMLLPLKNRSKLSQKCLGYTDCIPDQMNSNDLLKPGTRHTSTLTLLHTHGGWQAACRLDCYKILIHGVLRAEKRRTESSVPRMGNTTFAGQPDTAFWQTIPKLPQITLPLTKAGRSSTRTLSSLLMTKHWDHTAELLKPMVSPQPMPLQGGHKF
jgi:hypothetical protein